MARPRSQEKEKALIDAATELFLRRGVSQTTIKDIAEQADVAVGTVYVYYKDKIEVICRVAHAFADQHHALSDGVLRSRKQPMSKLYGYILGLYDLWLPFGENSQGSIELAQAVIKFAPETLSMAEREFLQTVETILKEGRTAGLRIGSAKEEARWIALATSPFFPLAGTPNEHPFSARLKREDLNGFLKWLGRKMEPDKNKA